MKLKFKVQSYQTTAVNNVIDCFAGQPMTSGLTYRIDPGQTPQTSAFEDGLRNADLTLTDAQILDNVQQVQRQQNLPSSKSLTDFTIFDNKGHVIPEKASYKKKALAAAPVHLDVEMETGTGKTYCYIKTIFEMNRRYGWSKFIIMVPSVAIREGVYKSMQIMADHFLENYSKRARFFIYNSKHLHELERFSSDAGINVMIINIQAFNARGADNRRIYEELDDFQTRKPIDVIAANRPILILDEPQKMEGKATMEALPKFKPLFILRYSATHRIQHNRVHRLDALDAYNQKLVKKIAVRGIRTRGLGGTNAYLYLEGIDISKRAPVARIEMEIKVKSGETRRQMQRVDCCDDLFIISGEMNCYSGFKISQIDATNDTVEFTNGVVLKAGEATGDVSEPHLRRIQIRETIKAHLEKEKQLFGQGVKVLSLFFIDRVVKYRDYDQDDQKGEYARIFEEEYEKLKTEYLETPDKPYRNYLVGIDATKTYVGYFSVDKKNKRMVEPNIKVRGEGKGLSDDETAYELILKNKERLLSLEKRIPRFIFSHSALREGWDNPNVFVMCMLKHSDNTVSRRQEVGRGLRLCVNQHGDRMDHPSTIHEINVLTVVASESYKDFVTNLQQEISEVLSLRPRLATQEYFTGKILTTEQDQITVTAAIAKQIYRYLVKNDYTDDVDQITDGYHKAKAKGTLAELPNELKPYAEQVFDLIDSIFSDAQLPKVEDSRKSKVNRLNANFQKREFKELWARINHKAVYRVDFDSEELIQKCVNALDSQLKITPLQYIIQDGTQKDTLTSEVLQRGDAFTIKRKTTEYENLICLLKYDLIAEIAKLSYLTRKTVATILEHVQPTTFKQFKKNPENFISEVSRIINEQKAHIVIEHLVYNATDERHDIDIFTANQVGQDFSRSIKNLKKHIYDHAIVDSEVEELFVNDLDTSSEVVVYAKLPRGFLIPTPVGDYNPDWAISFQAGSVKHIYFVAETKGTISSMELRGTEQAKIECARKFFNKISQTEDSVKYDVVDNYDKLLDIINSP